MKKFLIIISIVIVCLVGFTWLFLPSSTQIQFPNIKDLISKKESKTSSTNSHTNNNDWSQKESDIETPIEITNEFITKPKRSFEAVFSTQHYASILSVKQKITFVPTNKKEGTVHIKTTYSESQLSGMGNSESETTKLPYYIREDGSVVFGSLILEIYKGDLRGNNKGETILYHKRYDYN